jgi:hypothetical protein
MKPWFFPRMTLGALARPAAGPDRRYCTTVRRPRPSPRNDVGLDPDLGASCRRLTFIFGGVLVF